MFSGFFNIEPEKQTRIINSALKEFSQKGFSNASTNSIVKEANISKGILFHYFKNKKELYLFLYDYSLDIMGSNFLSKVDMMENDILIRWRQVALLKIELISEYPDIFKFILAANTEEAAEVSEDLGRRNKEFLSSNIKKLLAGIDLSLFKPGMDIQKSLDVILWTMEGFTAREQEKAKHHIDMEYNYQDILAQVDDYLELLRKCFYK